LRPNRYLTTPPQELGSHAGAAGQHPDRTARSTPWAFGHISIQSTMTDRLLAIQVECYAGYRGEQTPRAVLLGERRIEVAEVLDQWLAPDHRYFKLRGSDGHIYLVRHDAATHDWELTMFERGRATRE